MKQFILILLVPLVIQAEVVKDKEKQKSISVEGIQWINARNWDEVKKKAELEKKYIFVDAYATWCAPCKWMDENVFGQKKVEDFLNSRFISVKVQMDSSRNDDSQVKTWYKDAKNIMIEYNVGAFPTFLFFSPAGEIVHKDVGRKGVDDFIALAREAMDPQKQYYRLLHEFKTGVRDTNVMKQLARSAKKIGDKDLASEIAGDYLELLSKKQLFAPKNLAFMSDFQNIQKVQQILQEHKNYLNGLSLSSFCTEENVNFVRSFPHLVTSSDNIFKLFYHYPMKVDQIAKQRWFSKSFVSEVITREEIDTKLYSDDKQQQPVTKNANWGAFASAISQKYNKTYADEIVLDAQLRFYLRLRNWEEFGRLRDMKITRYPPKASTDSLFNERKGADMLNFDAWMVFLRCDDQKVLSQALNWVGLALTLEGESDNTSHIVDTKANILYKLGKVGEAISVEEKAVRLARASKISSINTVLAKVIEDNLTKMKNGKPTWTVK